MISLDGVTAVRRRIAEIEQTFGDPRNMLQGADFASNLRSELEKMKNAAKVERPEAIDKTNALDDVTKAASTLPTMPNVPQMDAASFADSGSDGQNANVFDAEFARDRGFSVPSGDEYIEPSVYDDAVKTTAGSDDVTRFLTEAAQRYGVDSRLVSAIAEVESSGNQAAISPVGAIGVMQLMPDTAAALGVDPYDAEENIDGGARYIRDLLNDFGGDVKKAVAAYNAGPNAVKAYGGVPPYAETQNYVSRVLDLYR